MFLLIVFIIFKISIIIVNTREYSNFSKSNIFHFVTVWQCATCLRDGETCLSGWGSDGIQLNDQHLELWGGVGNQQGAEIQIMQLSPEVRHQRIVQIRSLLGKYFPRHIKNY